MEAIVKRFNMLPHPEGGFFSETFRDEAGKVMTPNGAR